jgi:hypothetical protein
MRRKENKRRRAEGMHHFISLRQGILIFTRRGRGLVLHIAPLAMLITISGLGILIRNRSVTSKQAAKHHFAALATIWISGPKAHDLGSTWALPSLRVC